MVVENNKNDLSCLTIRRLHVVNALINHNAVTSKGCWNDNARGTTTLKLSVELDI